LSGLEGIENMSSNRRASIPILLPLILNFLILVMRSIIFIPLCIIFPCNFILLNMSKIKSPGIIDIFLFSNIKGHHNSTRDQYLNFYRETIQRFNSKFLKRKGGVITFIFNCLHLLHLHSIHSLKVR